MAGADRPSNTGDHADSYDAWTAVHAEGRPIFLVQSEPGSGGFVLPPGAGELPLMFSLRATKPAAG